MNKNHVSYLIKRYLSKSLTEAEAHELSGLLIENEDNATFHSVVEELIVSEKGEYVKADMYEWLPFLKTAVEEQKISGKPAHRVHFIRAAWVRYAAAAVIIIGIGAYLYSSQKEEPLPRQSVALHDVSAPLNSRATLTLDNGKQIFLDSAGPGTLAVEGQITIQKTGQGEIIYQGRVNGDVIQYNTLNVPRGSRIAGVVLSDGSKVLLNAGSSLKYPVVFTGTERHVEIIGEAFFEVTRDKSKRFIVEGGGISTEVLGTQFNVNTYADEIVKTVTLVEGSIKVAAGDAAVIVKPGEQVVADENKIRIDKNADIEQAMAWKNGFFKFNRAAMPEVMRQLSRWYDVDIVYEGEVPDIRLAGKMQRSLQLSQVLEILGRMGVTFRIEQKKIIVEKSNKK